MLVICDGEQVRALVVPMTQHGVMSGSAIADGDGWRGEDASLQSAVLAGSRARSVANVDHDVIARLAVVGPAEPDGNSQRYQHCAVEEVRNGCPSSLQSGYPHVGVR